MAVDYGECHEAYRACLDSGRTRECKCTKNKVRLLRAVATVINHARRSISEKDLAKLRGKPQHACIFYDAVINGLEGMIRCFTNKHTEDDLEKYCPEIVICEDRYVEELYRSNGYILKHPDVLIIKTTTFTMIIEQKRYGKQSRKEFVNQIESSYNYLPSELRSPCTFLIYAPLGGGTLPQGFRKHPKLSLLARDQRPRIVVYPIPVLIVEENLLQYMTYDLNRNRNRKIIRS